MIIYGGGEKGAASFTTAQRRDEKVEAKVRKRDRIVLSQRPPYRQGENRGETGEGGGGISGKQQKRRARGGERRNECVARDITD